MYYNYQIDKSFSNFADVILRYPSYQKYKSSKASVATHQ